MPFPLLLAPRTQKAIYTSVSRSAHGTPNFANPEFQFSQFKVLQSNFFLFNTKRYTVIFGYIFILI